MPIPKFDEMMLPILKLLGQELEGETLTSKQLRAFVISYYSLDDNDVSEMLPSGGIEKYASNMLWACTYMRQAKLIESPMRGTYRITERGRDVLKDGVEVLNKNYLMRFPEFCDFLNRGKKAQENKGQTTTTEVTANAVAVSMESNTPEQIIEDQFQSINTALADELIDMVMQQSPTRFEHLVVDLLLAMGYGDASLSAGMVTKQTGDEGIDGTIREDKLGFDTIYIQAKRWAADRTVNRPDIQAFVGALMGAGATKGLFITTARFSGGAQDYAEKQHAVKLVLVDGRELARLMITHNIGVSVRRSYDVKQIDSDYFEE